MQVTSQLLSEQEVSKYLGWSISNLRLIRRRGDGPAFYKVGRKVWYRVHDLEAFLAEKRRAARNSNPRKSSGFQEPGTDASN